MPLSSFFLTHSSLLFLLVTILLLYYFHYLSAIALFCSVIIELSFYFAPLDSPMFHLMHPQCQSYSDFVRISYPMLFYFRMDISMGLLVYFITVFEIYADWYQTVFVLFCLNALPPLAFTHNIEVYDG